MEDVAGKIFVLLVNNNNTEKMKNDLNFEQDTKNVSNQMEDFVEKNIASIFNNNEHQQGQNFHLICNSRLPLSATLEFMKDIRDILHIYSYNLFLKIS